MEPTQNTTEDPLVAALPPATDYITYLTLLEYQLKPQNLATLNGLLLDDDGTLASEIGWDLLKLVLPMLQIVPEDANRCLSIIARRGNPREVVVRVAEELERLGHNDDDQENDHEDEFAQEELPTFAGEAPRIHLGDMKLDGMPPQQQKLASSAMIEDAEPQAHHSNAAAEYGSDNILILQALLSMLSILHPRIKTQHPSRFLATSLPAALGAYRRMSITVDTTLAFIDFLSQLAGKQRPALPPRTSTASSIMTLSRQTTAPAAPEGQAAPLPDPEAKADPSSNNTGSLAAEKAITKRLLQAVMLEVLDEYTSSFQSTDFPTMAWTARLREKHEPRRVLPGRPTETQRWTQSSDLKARDEVIVKFLKLSKDLGLDISGAIGELLNPDINKSGVEEPESDYPTSPSQIPFPASGLVLLLAAQSFAQATTGLTAVPLLSLTTAQSLFMESFTPSGNLVAPPSLAQTDGLLSLIYTTLQSPLPPPTPTSATVESSTTPTTDLPFLSNLTNLFTTSPDPFIRDSTHHLTTLLLHHHTSSAIKLLYIKSLLSPHQSPSSPIHDIQQGNIRSLALTWLKDEFLAYTPAPLPTDAASATTSMSGLTISQPPTAVDPTTLPNPTQISTAPGLNPDLIITDPDLPSLIFPPLPATPTPFITGQPAAATGATTSLSSEPDLESFLLQLPAYASALNLLCILTSLPAEHHSVLHGPVLEHANSFITSIAAWKDLLLGFTTGIAQSRDNSPVNVSDIYALEDAVGRAKEAIEGLDE